MTLVSKKWNKTKNKLINWLHYTELKNFFANKIFYEKLSLWWLTYIYEKDALNDHQWYQNLNAVLNKEKIKSTNNQLNIFFEFIKTFFKFIKTSIILLFIKIMYSERKSKLSNYNDCVHVEFANLVEYKGAYIDTQYGLFSIKNRKIFYSINLQNDFFVIYDFFKIKKKLSKIPVNYYIVNKHLKFSDLFKVYLVTIKNFFLLNNELNKKNFFLIDKKDCSKILKPLLLKSFFGKIQSSLLYGISFHNLQKSIKFKKFITYLEFFPYSRAVYYFLKKDPNLKILSINHANFSNNMLAYSFEKKEFSQKNDYLNFSPHPDVFFTQGEKYCQKIKKVFPKNKVFKIGSLKLGIQKIKKFKNKLGIKKELNKNLKIITICLSTHDYLGMVEILNECNLKNFYIILRPHPYYKKPTLNFFKKKSKFKYYLFEHLSSRDLINISDFVISGDSSLCYESVIMGKNTIRLYNEKYHPLYDQNDGVIIVKNSKNLSKYLNKKYQIKNSSSNFIIRKFFFKYDKQAHLRLKYFINNL